MHVFLPLAVYFDVAAVGGDEATDDVEDRGFSGAIWPDESGDGALRHSDVDTIEDLQPT